MFQIGSTIRVTSTCRISSFPGVQCRSKKDDVFIVARRAIVATLPERPTNGTFSLVQDDLAPVPLHKGKKFLLSPMLDSMGKIVEDCEATASNLAPLLSFEYSQETTLIAKKVNSSIVDSVKKYKAYGDELLRLHDCTCAVSYYEEALGYVSSKFDSIGGTLVVRKNDRLCIAELDCMDRADGNDGGKYDVTYVLPKGNNEEDTIERKDILFAVWTDDIYQETFLQIRILLNLSRCLLRLAEVVRSKKNEAIAVRDSQLNTGHCEKYSLGAVLACSIAITLCEHSTNVTKISKQSVSLLSEFVEKALIIRAKSFVMIGKMNDALIDTKKVIHQNPSNHEAKDLMNDVCALKEYRKILDKKLSVEVSKWVQRATHTNTTKDAADKMQNSARRQKRDKKGITNCLPVVEDYPNEFPLLCCDFSFSKNLTSLD